MQDELNQHSEQDEVDGMKKRKWNKEEIIKLFIFTLF